MPRIMLKEDTLRMVVGADTKCPVVSLVRLVRDTLPPDDARDVLHNAAVNGNAQEVHLAMTVAMVIEDFFEDDPDLFKEVGDYVKNREKGIVDKAEMLIGQGWPKNLAWTQAVKEEMGK